MDKAILVLIVTALCNISENADANTEVDAGFCALNGSDVLITCTSSTPLSSSLLWELNGTLLGYRCTIPSPEFRDSIIIDECTSENPVFNLKLLEFNETLHGIYTCRDEDNTYNDTAELIPNGDPGVCFAAETDSDGLESEFSSTSESDLTLRYEPIGCYFPTPKFTWYNNDGETITEGVDTYSLDDISCEDTLQAMGSSLDTKYPGRASTVTYTCEVSYEESPDYVVNRKTFAVQNTACAAGVCIVLPVIFIVAVVAGVIGGVVFFKKKQNNNGNSTF